MTPRPPRSRPSSSTFDGVSANEDLDRILIALAAGEIDTMEAARRIEELNASPTAAPSAAESPASAGSVPTASGEPAVGQATPGEALTGQAPSSESPTGGTPSGRVATDQAPTSQPAGGQVPTDESASDQSVNPGQENAFGRPQFATYVRESFRRAEQVFRGPETPSGTDQPAGGSGSAARRPTGDVIRLVIRATGRRVRVVGDSSVATVTVDGPHVVRRIGDTLEVTSEKPGGPSLRAVNPVHPPHGWDDVRDAALGKEIVVHVNPRITVDADITGGSLSTAQLPQLGRIRVTGGGANLTDVHQVSDALIQVGNATVRGKLDSGRSRVQVESGMLSVILDPDASVTVRSQTQLGRVSWPGSQSGQLDEFVAGNGAGQLDIGVVMGYASVRFADASHA